MACGDNKGLAASSFLSAAFGVNIVLAKWEAFKKTLTEVDTQLGEVFREELKTAGKSAALVDDESDEMKMIQSLCAKHLKSIREKNIKRWKRSRRWAICFSWITISLLFLQITAGVWGIAFMGPLLFSSWSCGRSRKKITVLVRSKIDQVLEVMNEHGAQNAIKSAMSGTAPQPPPTPPAPPPPYFSTTVVGSSSVQLVPLSKPPARATPPQKKSGAAKMAQDKQAARKRATGRNNGGKGSK